VQITKAEVVELLKQRGAHGDAQEAARVLPDRLDLDRHSGLLSRFGLNARTLRSQARRSQR